MLALRSDAVLMRDRHRVLNKTDLDSPCRRHLVANDPCRLFAPFIGIRSNPAHRMNVGAAEAALPMLRRVRSDIAHGTRAASHADTERFGEAVQRPLRQSQRLQSFVSEADIDGESCPMLLRP